MPRRAYLAAAVFVAAASAAACRRPSDPIGIENQTITIENRTRQDWRGVTVTVNDHFRGGAPVLAAGSRLTAPLSQFQTGFGQRYDIQRQAVFKIEVTATDSDGAPVKLESVHRR
jgi:type IV pilus biogenesis protein CpaD/CtpE